MNSIHEDEALSVATEYYEHGVHPDYQNHKGKCTSTLPCLCMTNNYIDPKVLTELDQRNLQAKGEFKVAWSLSLGGKDSLLESAFLNAAFAQSVKDYINNDILCSSNLAIKGAEFFGVEIANGSQKNTGKWMAVSGNGKCKGDVKKCKVPIKAKKQEEEDDDIFAKKSDKRSKSSIDIHSRDFCDDFLKSTIFDSFEERLITASFFNYDVDVDVINDLKGSLDLKYDVSFEPAPSDGLDQVDDVDAVPDEPIAISPVCEESQCLTQRQILRRIFTYFNFPFDDSKHECLFQGINCDANDMVTHIWMGKFTIIFFPFFHEKNILFTYFLL